MLSALWRFELIVGLEQRPWLDDFAVTLRD
jgi:hypothetical protein